MLYENHFLCLLFLHSYLPFWQRAALGFKLKKGSTLLMLCGKGVGLKPCSKARLSLIRGTDNHEAIGGKNKNIN